jgi:hypothetical protein
MCNYNYIYVVEVILGVRESFVSREIRMKGIK